MAHSLHDVRVRQTADGLTTSDLSADGLATAAQSLASADRNDHAAFIADNCRRLAVPLVPEVSLLLAHEALPLWQKTEEELGEIGLPPPFWAFAWAGGQALARYVLDHPDCVRDKTVIDLATGSGLVGIAAKLAGAKHVRATDIDRYACTAVRLNARAMNVRLEVNSSDLLNWRPPRVDTILTGDIFYERPLAERTLNWLQRARDQGTSVLVGDPGRSYLPRDQLVRLMDYSVPVSRELEDTEIKHTTVWRLL